MCYDTGMTYYITFGQKHPLRDNWIEVEAPNYDACSKEVFDIFGSKYAFIYPEKEMTFKRMAFNFPGGKVGNTINA